MMLNMTSTSEVSRPVLNSLLWFCSSSACFRATSPLPTDTSADSRVIPDGFGTTLVAQPAVSEVATAKTTTTPRLIERPPRRWKLDSEQTLGNIRSRRLGSHWMDVNQFLWLLFGWCSNGRRR